MSPCDALISRAIGQFHIPDSLKSVAKVISGNIAANLISMVTSILIVRWIVPHEMGLWNAALLVTIYSPALQLGVFNGLNRELPYLIGAGDKDRALQMAQAAYAWSYVLMGVSTLSGALVAVWFWMKGQPVWCFTSLAVAVLVVCSWPTNYLTTTYRTNSEFGRLAKNTVVVALAGAALVMLVWRFHFNGLLVRAASVGILGVAALYYRRPLPVRPRWETRQLIQLARVGLPIWLAGMLSLFFMSMDRLILVRSTQVLGYFTIAIQMGAFVRLIPTAFPRLSCIREWHIDMVKPTVPWIFGESQERAHSLHRRSGWSLVRAGGYFCRLLSAFVLPKYGPGIRAAQWSRISSGWRWGCTCSITYSM